MNTFGVVTITTKRNETEERREFEALCKTGATSTNFKSKVPEGTRKTNLQLFIVQFGNWRSIVTPRKNYWDQ